jgi:hypothetical protein
VIEAHTHLIRLRGQSEICVEGAVRQGGFSRQLSDQVTDG